MPDGAQEIQIGNEKPFHVRCDGDGWMIIQQRINGAQEFNKSWQEYVDGFGDLQGDFFIGLEKLHLITSSTRYKLNVSIAFNWYKDGSGRHDVQYDDFRIGNSGSSYELESIGKFSGSPGMNAFVGNEKPKFSTYDKNYPHWAKDLGDIGGWWFAPNFNF
ncbi:hypothetical protein KR044_010272, partial [Drosophila immigrans]